MKYPNFTLENPVVCVFRGNRTRQMISGVVAPLASLVLLGAAIIQFMIKTGWVDYLGSSRHVDVVQAGIELIGACAFAAIALRQFISFSRGLPLICIEPDAIKCQDLSGTYWVHWSSLSSFDIATRLGLKGVTYRVAQAKITGPLASPSLNGRRSLTLYDRYETDLADIVERLNAERSAYLTPAETTPLAFKAATQPVSWMPPSGLTDTRASSSSAQL